MKKSVSIVYTMLVLVVLFGVTAYFGWTLQQTRLGRIADFSTRSEEYTQRLATTLLDQRDVDSEVELAESLMNNDLALVAVQVYSHDDGLRLSVVKPPASEFRSKALVDTPSFGRFPTNWRYHMVRKPMVVEDMPGLETHFVTMVVGRGEIQNAVMIILITVLGLFAITLILALIRPAAHVNDDEMETEEESSISFDEEFPPSSGHKSQGDDFHDELTELPPEDFSDLPSDEAFDDNIFESSTLDEDFDLPDFDDVDRLDDGDLMMSNPEMRQSEVLDDDFDLPSLDDEGSTFDEDLSLPPSESSPAQELPQDDEFLARLESELERAAAFDQDLSLLVITTGNQPIDPLRDAFTYHDLLFPLEEGRTAVIEPNSNLDASIAAAEDLLRHLIAELGGDRPYRIGIASRNGRLIGSERLFEEALGALTRTDEKDNIVAFRSDPEKYREYVRSLEE
ncbi:MAG: hypothetical protein MI717_07805 [Spirochaetales bacterium]|nr:hypothetical protein [Spirochaetales bacterium]